MGLEFTYENSIAVHGRDHELKAPVDIGDVRLDIGTKIRLEFLMSYEATGCLNDVDGVRVGITFRALKFVGVPSGECLASLVDSSEIAAWYSHLLDTEQQAAATSLIQGAVKKWMAETCWQLGMAALFQTTSLH